MGKRQILLLELVARRATLEAAWRAVRMRSSAHSKGIDDIKREDFERSWPEERERIRAQLLSRSYKFSRYLGQPIKKKNNADPCDLKAWRPVSIAAIRDRVVQRAILDRIWCDIREHVHTDASFGGIRRYSKPAKKKSDTPEVEVRKCVRTAAERIVELRVSGYPWIFETDIESFFPSINRKRLFRDLSLSLRDDSINDLIEASLDTSVANVDDLGVLADLWNPEMGVPQGGVLSPVLANFYLYEHDRQMTAAGFKLIRYVDDLIVLATSEREAHEAYRKCEMVLKTLDLHIHPLGQESNGRIKTNIHRPNEPFEFLGLTFASSSIQPTHKKMDKLREKLLAITECKGSRLKLREVIERLNWCVTGWVKAYDFCNLSRKQLQEIDALVGHYVRRWLVHRGIIAKMNKLDAKAFSWLGIKCAQDIHLKPIMRRSGRDEQDQQKRVAAGDSLLSLTAN